MNKRARREKDTEPRLVQWTARALSDADEIIAYIVAQSPRTAASVAAALADRAGALGAHPHTGKLVPEFDRPDVRQVITRGYRLIYQVTEKHVSILTVQRATRTLRVTEDEQE